jgi:hypothetical protein
MSTGITWLAAAVAILAESASAIPFPGCMGGTLQGCPGVQNCSEQYFTQDVRVPMPMLNTHAIHRSRTHFIHEPPTWMMMCIAVDHVDGRWKGSVAASRCCFNLQRRYIEHDWPHKCCARRPHHTRVDVAYSHCSNLHSITADSLHIFVCCSRALALLIRLHAHRLITSAGQLHLETTDTRRSSGFLLSR